MMHLRGTTWNQIARQCGAFAGTIAAALVLGLGILGTELVAQEKAEPAQLVPTLPAEAAKQPAEAPKQPAEAPKQPAEAPKQPAEAPKQPAEAPKQPAEVPKPSAEAPKPISPADSIALGYERTLLDHKIEPTLDGLKAYLISLHPTPDTQKVLTGYVAQLGAESFTAREEAMQQLRQRSAIAMETLKAASVNTDPEIRWRAKKLLENAVGDTDATFFAVFKIIEARQFKGLTGPILMTLPLCAKDHVRFASRRALAATATPNDAVLLRQELKNADPQVRIAVLGALQSLSEKEAVEDALTLVNDADENVKLAAARALAQQARRESLPLLVSLLDAEAVEVRADANRTLRIVTAQDFSFVAYDKEAERAAARDKWKEWLAASGQSVKLLPFAKDAPFEYGRLLVCSYAQSKVYEFDGDAKDPNKPRWEVQLGMQPWAVQGLADGRRLVAYYGGRKIVEYGPEKEAQKPIWESEALPGGPMGLQRLDNGNTLVACTDAEMVVELDAQGKIVKKWTLAGRPVDVQRLDNGNTLVTLQNGQKIVEIDQEGNVKWSTKIPITNPFSAQRLENGNTLIAVLSGGKVIEVNPAGDREEWVLSGLVNPYHARRLSNGNTLVVDQNGVYEYETRQKRVVWKLAIPHVSRASRF